jgi:integrase
LTPNAARRTLTNINACCNWALKSQLIDANPFTGMASEIKLTKGGQEDLDIRSFSREERDIIINAFEESKIYKYYSPLVKFLFFTGCRPSEAIAIQWKQISADWRFVTFEQSITISSKGLAIKDGLKTQSSRKFPINNQLNLHSAGWQCC